MKIQFDDEREDITIKEEEKDVKKLKVKKPKQGKKASKKQ